MERTQEEGGPRTKLSKQSRIICNIAFTKYEIVKHVAGTLFKWGLSNDKLDENWDIMWTDSAVPPDKLSNMKQYQKINHFPGMYNVSRKNYLAYNLMKLKKLFPDEYDFFPRTWVVPCDMGDLKAYMQLKKNSYFIVKPEASCQGRGIFLTKRFDEIDSSEKHVVQEYIEKPFLIDGLKFDLRIYVLVTGCEPLRIFIHDQGLTRFATEEYKKPNEGNFEDMCMHLTNYAINKNNPNFIHNENSEEDDIGHKRSLQSTFDYLEENGYDVVKLKSKIDDMIIKTLCSVQPNLRHHYHSCQPDDYSNSMCFELLGFDVILDHKLNPYVLEVNHTPSFSTDSPLDWKTKEIVISEALVLMNISSKNRRIYIKKQKQELNKRALTGKIERDSKSVREEKRVKFIIRRDKWEEKHRGGYRKVYPVNDEKYEKMIKAADEIYQEWTGTKITRIKKAEEEKIPIIKKPPKIENKLPLNKIENSIPKRCPTATLRDMESPSTVSLLEIEKKNPLEVFERLSKVPIRKPTLPSSYQNIPGIVYHDDRRSHYLYGNKYCLTFHHNTPEHNLKFSEKNAESQSEAKGKVSLIKATPELLRRNSTKNTLASFLKSTSGKQLITSKALAFGHSGAKEILKKWNL
ncbi:unnamed protein product [Blepharisma stoltei]|uniref:Tubulin polyglutamylase TTLL6 n=1 Tax=Blepharisma stoltei TaxID=1481888 RepID=A0AAU9IZS4_9CILI|nr:unnamed protein product [Blepharisma stoltei]